MLGYPILSMRSIPKDPRVARPLLRGGPRGAARIETPLEVSDVWPENYSANWRRRCGRRSSPRATRTSSCSTCRRFKCGHDAPTYGLIDSIIASAATPYSALHDIDANKPGGSIKIRVKTYAHTLKLHEERLEDTAHRKDELKYRDGREAARAARAEARSSWRRASSRIRRSKRMIDETKAKVAEYSKRVEANRRSRTPREQAKDAGWCGSESRSASTTAKSWRASRRSTGGNHVETVDTKQTSHEREEPHEASDRSATTRHRRRRRAARSSSRSRARAPRPRGRQASTGVDDNAEPTFTRQRARAHDRC